MAEKPEESKANWLKLAWDRDPLTFLLTIFTGLLALFTGLQAYTLGDATKISERAWVMLKSAQFSNIAVGQKPSVSLIAENSGKSPATDFATSSGLVVLSAVPPQGGPMPEVQPRGLRSVGILGPGMSVISTTQLEHVLTADEIESVKNGHQFLYYFGMVRYRDIFGINRYTQFCFEANPENLNGPANVCDQWNTMK
jgi:hypothetical protein